MTVARIMRENGQLTCSMSAVTVIQNFFQGCIPHSATDNLHITHYWTGAEQFLDLAEVLLQHALWCLSRGAERCKAFSVEEHIVIQPHPLHNIGGVPHFSRYETSVAVLRVYTVLLLKRLQLFLHFCEMPFILLYM